MAEGFVLNIPKEMLDRLQKADEKIEKLDKNSRRVSENIRLAFMEGAKGVDKFIGSLNAAQIALDKFKDKKINVGLNLDAKAIDELKKQLSTAGVNIPVGVTGTGGGSAGESQSLKDLLNGIVTLTTSVNNLTQKIDGIKVTGSGSTSGGSGSGTSNGEKTDKGIGSYKSKINELLQIEKLIHDIDKAQTELAKKGDKSLSGKSLSTISNLRQQADKLLEELKKIEEKTNKDLSGIQTKWHAKELAEEQKQAKDNIAIQEKEANDLIKIEEREIKEYERLMGKMLKLRKDINANTDLIYSPNPKVSQDALAQITKQEALLKQFEARAKTLEGKYGAGLSEIQLKYSQKELEMLNKAINNPTSNSGIDQKTKDLREYEKVLKRISDLEKVRDRASKAISKYGANSQIGQQANTLYQQAERLLQQHNQRRIALEQQYGTELDSIKQAQNAKDLNYLIQQKDAELRVTEQAEKKAIQQYTKLANERNRLLTEQYKTEKIANDPKADSATRQLANQQLQQITAELQRNKQEMLNIEQQYQGKLATIQQRAGQQELQRVRRQNQEEIDEVRRAEQRRQDIQRRWDERRYSRPQGALQYSQNAKTINEQIKAIEYLKKAQKSLDVSTSQGKKQFNELEKEIKKTENALRRYGVQLGGVREQSSHLFNISQQLGRALSLMFSVSQIGQYISKMVNVRKEMELQQRSLQVLLQSKDKANELWNQTLDLAVKSPFRVKELVTYTKQLSAYRIESDKLFETNKMLADVSAGLGVDMQRLILAFGQVKSASFLRGTELRQFTEAGIPMLEELSKYFEELYGRSISVAEVFDMISKRMVTFTDVETVFQRMTSAGGVFFNMQEELSQTTAGMISNLQDSIDLMFNEIGKKNQGVVNTAIKLAKGLVDNWETIGKVMKGTLVTLLAYQSATGNITNMLYKMRDAASNIAQNFKSGFSLHPVSMALTTLAMVIAKVAMEWKRYKDEVKKVEKAHADVIKSVNDIENGFSDLFSNNVNDVEEYKNKLQELVDVAKQKYNIEVKFKVNELDNFAEITQKFDELKAQILILNDLSKQFSVEFAKDKGVKWGWFQDFIGEDLTQLGTKQQDIKDVFSGLKSSFSDVFKNFVDVEQLDNSLEEAFNKINSFGIDKKTDLINNFKDVIGSPLDLEGKAFDEVLKELNINDLTKENKEELERLVRNFIETERVLKEKKSTIGNLNKEIFESFKPQSSDEIDRDYLQRQFEAIKLVYREREKLKKYYIDKGYNTSALKRANEDIKSMYGFELDATFYNNVIKPYETALGEATDELNDFYKANEGYVKNVVSDLNLLGTSAEDMAKEVSVAISSALKNVATEKELSPLVLEEMLAQAEEYYSKALNLELDLMPKVQPVQEKDLEKWQKDLKDKLEKNKDLLLGSIPMVTFQTTQEKALKDAEDAWKGTESLIKRIENAQKQKDNDLASWYSQYNLEELKKKMQVEKDIWTELGGSEDKKGKNTAEERIKEQIRLIKELYQEYQKLSKEYGSSKAKGIVTKSFETLLKDVGLDINNIDFTNLQGVIDSLTSLRGQAATAGKEASQELEKAIGETSVELGLILKVKEREDTAKEIENMFSDYEMTIDLKKLDIPQNLAEDLFDVNWTDLGDIKQRLEQERSALEKENKAIQEQIANAYKNQVSEETIETLKLQAQGNKDRLEDIDKFYQKWNEAERKSTEERLKTYYKYLLNEQHERVKIRLETLRKLQEVEATSEFTNAQKKTITNKLKEEENQALAKQTWKDFETSPMYMQLFDDIENMSTDALESVIAKMQDLYKSMLAAGVSASNLKEILNQIDKAEEAIDRRNPFRNFGKNISNVFKGIKEYEKERKQYEEALKKANDEYNLSQLSLANAYDYLSTLEEGSVEYNRQLIIVNKLTEQTNKLEKDVENIETELTKTNNNISSIFNSVVEFQQQMQDIDTLVNSAGEGFLQIAEAVGGIPEETKDTVKQLVDLEHSLMNIVSGILRIIYEDKIAGIAQLVDGVVNLVVVTAGLVSGENKLNREIEKQGRILSDLQNKYDRLNEAIDEAWNITQIKQYNAELERNLQQQIAAQEQIVSAYEDMKGADEYGSVEWERLQEAKDELLSLYDIQQELQDNIYSKLTGGIMDDVLSTTESFVDAWYDAFKETGDGLKGLEDSFNEMLLNLVKRQAAMKIAGRFVDEWDKALERYASDGDLSNSEIEYYANKVKNDLPELSSQLETFFSSFDNVLGDTSGNLSSLQRGISSITESQADILASYLNSIRFIVSDSNSQLKALLAAQTSTSASNPIVAQLQVIAQQASAINTLLNSLTAKHPTQSGLGFKVII